MNDHWLIELSVFNGFIYCYMQVNSPLLVGPGDPGSIPGCVIPKTLKMVLDNLLA